MGAERRQLGLVVAGSFSTSRWSAAARFGRFPSKARGEVALGGLDDVSWLDGGARPALEHLGDDDRLESKRQRDLVL
jgi:hypothetical protein